MSKQLQQKKHKPTEKILELNALEERIKWDAYYILAKTAEKQKDWVKAKKHSKP